MQLVKEKLWINTWPQSVTSVDPDGSGLHRAASERLRQQKQAALA